jgi:hypothetical protein
MASCAAACCSSRPCTGSEPWSFDAALCAWLGWLTRTAPERVHPVGLPLWRDAEGWLREGRILDIRRT